MTTNITVIGAGPGGYVAAIRAAQLGAEVTVIEDDNVGGTCLNWGCIPSKIMITTAEILEKFHQSHQYGIEIDGNVRLDMQRLMTRKNSVIQSQTKGILDLFKHHKIQYIKGTGYIKKPGLVAVRQPRAEEIEVPWDKLILATGTKPFSIPGIPFDGKRILSSDHALSLEEVPESIVIVGGGVIGCEFACIFNAWQMSASACFSTLPAFEMKCLHLFQ